MTQITIATCLEKPAISVSDQHLLKALEARGAKVTGAAWNGPFGPFADADQVIIRTTWDYFDRVNDFYDWLDRLERNEVSVANSIATLRWNARKHYLFELQQAGLPLIKTIQVQATVEDVMDSGHRQGWRQCVLKCLVSGGALGLSLIDIADKDDVTLALKNAQPWSKHGLMLQPFLPEIQTEGELSLIFIAGKFSHAVQKLPKLGDFRIQSEFGGQYQRVEVSSDTLDAATRCLGAAPGMPQTPPLYARVDGLIVDGQFQLMELELTEPELMLNLAPEAADKMAAVILNQPAAH